MPHAFPTYPADHAWLWDAPGVGECLLSRGEAAVIDTLARGTNGPITVVEVKAASDALMATTLGIGGAVPRGWLARVGDAAVRALHRVGLRSLPAFHSAMAKLHAKGLVEPGPGRASPRWTLIRAGRAAAALVAAMGKEAIDRVDPTGHGARLAHEALEAVLDAPSLRGVVTSTVSGYRVEADTCDGHPIVSYGNLERYTLVMADLDRRLAVARRGVSAPARDTFRLVRAGGEAFDVLVERRDHATGKRTTLTFRPVDNGDVARPMARDAGVTEG